MNPLAPSAEALAAHERQPAGTVYLHLTDDPETQEEARAERQRRRIQDWHRRKQAGEPKKRVARSLHDGRFIRAV